MAKVRGSGKGRKVLKDIPYYPSPAQLFKLIMESEGWPYAWKKDFYLVRDRSLVALLYLGCLRISEAIRIAKNQFVKKRDFIQIHSVKLSKSKVRGQPRRIQFRDVQLPLKGERKELTMLILDYVKLIGDNARLYPFSLEKRKYIVKVKVKGVLREKEVYQLIGCKRAWQIVKALLPDATAHWLRAYGEDFLYDAWDHDILAVADYAKVDPRTLESYLRKRHERYPVV